ncbi:hypothetical protein M9Y10_014140 [Tritrichomonas musculus]|uniref:Ras-GAP domain-containing protein n=1 Tax=Tritrichomonas musculus TaxID=1915356 RepID=A0ABR2KYR3_9EUKA
MRFHRKFRSEDEPDWPSTSKAWKDLMKTPLNINFKDLFDQMVRLFHYSPSNFIDNIRKSYHICDELPINYLISDVQKKTVHFFSYFKLIFPKDELEKFIKQPNFQPENVEKSFSNPDVPILFHSICYLYQLILQSMKDDINEFNKYAPQIAFVFGKLLVPEGTRHLESTTFHLDQIYMSPVYFSAEKLQIIENSNSPSKNNDSDKYQNYEKLPAILEIDENGIISIYKASDYKFITKIDQTTFTPLIETNSVLFFDNGTKPLITIQFPSSDCSADAFDFSLSPPRRGFMQMSSFLHSIKSFKNISSFFPSEVSKLPAHFTSNLQQCLCCSTMELLFYEFIIPASEAKVIQDNIDFFIDAIGDNILPFIRALVELNWMMTPYGSMLILRQNSQLTLLCRMFLRIFADDYSKYILNGLQNIIESGSSYIKSMPINDESDAINFIEKVWDPLVNLLFNSVSKMPSILRTLLRILFVRCAGFYVNEPSPFLVVPNLLLLRFLLPPFTELSVKLYAREPKVLKISQLAQSSLLSLFYFGSWSEDKEPVLSKHKDAMKKYYKKAEKFEYEIVNCTEFDYNYKNVVKPEGDLFELAGNSAERVITMNMKDPNKILHSHIYCVSLMQMIEEYTFDFTTNDK